MIELGIDIETYSETDIKLGARKYAEDPKFELLLFAYQFTGKPKKIIDLTAGERIPTEVLSALWSPDVVKTAYNAAFEIACLNQYFGRMLGSKNIPLDYSQWSCTQAWAAQAGLPFGLDNVAKVLGTDAQKDAKGKALIKYFCVPCKPSKVNKQRTRNLPQHDFDKWLEFKDYCLQDVATEQDIRTRIAWFIFSAFERRLWVVDQKINDRGVMADMQLVSNAVKFDDIVSAEVAAQIKKLTGIENPNSDAQIKKYVLEQTGIKIASLAKDVIEDVYKQFKGTPIEPILKLREQLSRTSIKKFVAVLNSACLDKRVRDMFLYYGANRTGRWAGRNVQLHNLKRNNLKELALVREIVRQGNLSVLKLMYDDVGLVLSNLIRTVFISPEGKDLVVTDFSAIEARVVAWFANEVWRLNVFNTHGKIYEASASMMFNIPLESVTKDLRQKGKIAELALGYGGAVGAMERMGGSSMGLSEEDMLKIVVQWRRANKQIVAFWKFVEQSCVAAIQGEIVSGRFLKFYKKNGNLIIQLPNGRNLVYIAAKYDGRNISYMGVDQETKQWGKLYTYGGKLVENIVQATARDILSEALVKIDSMGFDIVMHVHDEIVVEELEHKTKETAEVLTKVLSTPIAWAPGLPLGAETFTAKFYQK